MSSNIETVLVRDDILTVSDKIGYAVSGCPQNVSSQVFTAISATANSQIYTITVPSTSTVMSREVLWTCQFTVALSGSALDTQPLFQPSKFFALGPMPLSQMCTNLALQINTTTASVTLNRVLDPVMRSMDRKKFSEAYGTTPTYLDNVGTYAQLNSVGGALQGYVNNPLGGYQDAVDPLYPPRGSFKIIAIDNPLGTVGAPVKTGSITFQVTEPIFLSPFCYDGSDAGAGLSGISNINATFNMDSLAQRAVRWYNDGVANLQVTGVTFVPAECSLECVFVTPAVDQLVPATCVTPYCNLTNYVSTLGAPLAIGGTIDFNSSNIQLNGIPDGIIINIRPQFGSLSPSCADSYATINNVSINFDNQNGLLSSASQRLLWNFSKQSGSGQSWGEFYGQQNAAPTQGGGFTNLGLMNVATTGSVLYLKFGTHITIPNAYNAPGSSGNFNLQLRVNATNNTGVAMDSDPNNIAAGNGGNPELNIIVVQSGLFVSQNGQSQTYLNILTRQQVLDAKLQAPVARTELKRLLGGGFFSGLKAIAQKAMPHVRAFATHISPHVKSFVKEHVAPMLKEHLAASENPLAHLAHAGVTHAGYGMSAGGMSGGRSRVGRHLKM